MWLVNLTDIIDMQEAKWLAVRVEKTEEENLLEGLGCVQSEKTVRSEEVMEQMESSLLMDTMIPDQG